MRINSYIATGNSFPVILEDDQQQYFVKLRAGMSGQQAMLSEWIGNKLGAQIGIKTQTPKWIELNEEVKFKDGIHLEVKELVTKSVGLNIGFTYLEKAQDISKVELAQVDKQTLNEIFLFDLLMINVDRTPNNMNLMKVDEEIISVDYESSLLVQELIHNKSLLSDQRILQCLRNNPLYEDLNEEITEAFIQKIRKISIGSITSEIPAKLLNENTRNLIVENYEFRKKHNWFLNDTLKKLKTLKTETKEELKRKRQQNQADFKRKFEENRNK